MWQDKPFVNMPMLERKGSTSESLVGCLLDVSGFRHLFVKQCTTQNVCPRRAHTPVLYSGCMSKFHLLREAATVRRDDIPAH